MKQFSKTFLRIILIIGNIILFCILGVVYFFGFDIQWGLTWQSVTWGLPLLTAIALVIFYILKFLRKRNWRWGMSGIGVAVIALVYAGLVFWFYGHLLVSAPSSGPKETLDTEENQIISQVLSTFFKDGRGYAVVYPETYPEQISHPYGEKFINEFKENFKRGFPPDSEEMEKIIEIVERLFAEFDELNKQEERLSIKSSPEDGYYIDYDHKYLRDDFSLFWLRMRLFRPNVGPLVDVSIPAYDADSGIFVIHIGMAADELIGSGHIWVMKYIDDRLIPIFFYETWIS